MLLRLAIGWHFFSEGIDKIEHDPDDGSYRITFLGGRIPVAGQGTAWPIISTRWRPAATTGRQLLAVPQQNEPTRRPRKRKASGRASHRITNWHDTGSCCRLAGDRWTKAIAASRPDRRARSPQAKAAFENAHAQSCKAYLAGESRRDRRLPTRTVAAGRMAKRSRKPPAFRFDEERIATKAAETTGAGQGLGRRRQRHSNEAVSR